MNPEARDIAEFYARSARSVYSGAIYTDGLILGLAVSEETARQWIEAMKATDYAVSPDGLIWVIVLRGEPDDLFAVAGAVGATLHADWDRYATVDDNRHPNHHTIDLFHSLVKEVNHAQI